MKHLKLYENFAKGIIVYHRSDELSHMERADFDLSKSDDEFSIFGQAVYFSSSPSMSKALGKYICKFEIQLEDPILDMNESITLAEADKMLADFNKMFKTDYEIDFTEGYEDDMQYGQFFLEINDLDEWEPRPNTHFKDFIHSLGYKSFKHFTTYDSDFRTDEGDYGTVYGIYNTRNIKFVDGPF